MRSLCVLTLLAGVLRAQSAHAAGLLPLLRPTFGAVPVPGPGAPVAPLPGTGNRVFTLVPSSPARAAQERAFWDAVLALVASTQEGRRILADLDAQDQRIPVAFVPMDKTSLTADGPESVDGTAGQWDPKAGRMMMNELFLSVGDQTLARADAAATLAHECEHARLHAAAKRMTPWYDSVLTLDAANERNAFLSGYLVAAELGVETGALAGARGLAADPPGTWERKRLNGPLYALALTLDEMKDPIGAWTARSAALKARLAKLDDQLGVGIPWTRRALDHMERLHGVHVPELRADLEHDYSSMSDARDEVRDSIDFVDTRIALFSDPAKQAAFKDELALAAGDPRYAALTGLIAPKLARLKRIVPPEPAAKPAAPSGKMTWPRFYDLVEKDRAAHPEHWDKDSGEPIGMGPGWKVCLAELRGS